MNPVVLWYCSRAIIHNIHSVFLPHIVPGHNSTNPASLKKQKDKRGAVRDT
jgi:hypothetical protein